MKRSTSLWLGLQAGRRCIQQWLTCRPDPKAETYCPESASLYEVWINFLWVSLDTAWSPLFFQDISRQTFSVPRLSCTYRVTLVPTWMLPPPSTYTLSTKVQWSENIRVSWEFHEGSCSLPNTLQLCLLSKLPMAKRRLERQLQ